jgi:hypothetical protein
MINSRTNKTSVWVPIWKNLGEREMSFIEHRIIDTMRLSIRSTDILDTMLDINGNKVLRARTSYKELDDHNVFEVKHKYHFFPILFLDQATLQNDSCQYKQRKDSLIINSCNMNVFNREEFMKELTRFYFKKQNY